jgi:hypothetical protein
MDSAPAGAIPSLVPSFAAVGFAAAWLIDYPDWVPRLLPCGLAALAGGVAGLVLTRYCRRSVYEGFPRRALGLRLMLTLLPAGVAWGLAFGVVRRSSRDAMDGMTVGLVGVVLAFPICALLLWAALRAERARLGSIVAAADRRAIVAWLVAAYAALAAKDADDWLPARLFHRDPPFFALSIALGASIAAVWLLVSDARDLRRVAALAKDRSLEPIDDVARAEEGASAPIDLGLGAEVRTRAARGAAYRTSPRVEAVVKGSIPEATRALRRALARDVGVIAIAAIAAGAHLNARSERAWRAYVARLCDFADAEACLVHARILEAQGGPRMREGWNRAFVTACLRGHHQACDVAAQRAAEDRDRERETRMRDRSCDLGSAKACALAGPLHLPDDEVMAFDRFVKACTGDIGESCCEAARLASRGAAARYIEANEYRRVPREIPADEARAENERRARELVEAAAKLGKAGEPGCVEAAQRTSR